MKLSLSVFLFFSSIVFSQTITIKGKVYYQNINLNKSDSLYYYINDSYNKKSTPILKNNTYKIKIEKKDLKYISRIGFSPFLKNNDFNNKQFLFIKNIIKTYPNKNTIENDIFINNLKTFDYSVQPEDNLKSFSGIHPIDYKNYEHLIIDAFGNATLKFQNPVYEDYNYMIGKWKKIDFEKVELILDTYFNYEFRTYKKINKPKKYNFKIIEHHKNNHFHFIPI